MIKSDEMEVANSCWNKALSHERVFVALARDAAAPDTIRFWANERVHLGLNQPGDLQIIEALECAAKMEAEREQIRNEVAFRKSLRLFQSDYGDGNLTADMVIAADESQALALLCDLVGETPEVIGWKVWDPQANFTVTRCDEPGQPSETKTVRQWIDEVGRGYWFGWA